MKRREFFKGTGGALILIPNLFSLFKEKETDIILKVWKVVTEVENMPVIPEERIKELLSKVLESQYYFVKDTFRMGIKILDVLPVLKLKFRRFSNMPLDEAREFFLSLRESSIPQIRGLYLSLKSVVLFLYYSSPETWEYTGYEGPWVKE